MPLTAMADSYTSLWKQYEAARRKDHPQTAIKVLSRISDKATRERAYGHLLKAQLATADNMAAISPDSLLPAVDRMKACEQRAEKNGDKVLAAIYQSVLGTVYTQNHLTLDDGKAIGKELLRKSMANPDALAKAFSTAYDPFVVDGVDSKYYYDDMLHVIGMAADDYEGMHAYYDSHGKREAASLTALQLAKKARRAGDEGRVKKSKYVMSLDSLMREYSDLATCGEIAIERYAYMENAEDVSAEDKNNFINYALMKWGAWPRMNILRNAQRRLTLPSFHVSLGGEIALPGVKRNVVVMALNNIGEIKVSAYRLDIDGTTKLNPSVDKDYDQLRRHIIQAEQPVSDVRRYVGLPAYKTINDTLELDGLRTGMYLVEVSTDNTSVPVERALLRVCNIYPLVQSLPGKRYRIALLNATDGTAMPGAKVDVVMSEGKNSKDDVVKTFVSDVNGEVLVDYEGNEPVAYRVYTDGDNAFPRSSMASRFYYYNKENRNEAHADIYTDRRIYRPGQTVHVAAIAYDYNRVSHKASAKAGQTFNVVLRNANHQEVAKHSVTTDEYGMANTDFVLPAAGLNGIYTLQCDYGTRQFANFSVEEYKRPTFRVDIDKVSEKYAAGDTVCLKASACTFASVPVQGAKVAVRVVRRPSMFWRAVGGDMRHETVFTDTLTTGTDGTFTVKVPVVVPDSYEEQPRRYFTFDVTADVTDANGETRHGEMSLPYSDRPTIFTCDVPEKSLADSLRTITFSYRNNAGEPIDGDVTYFIDSNRYTCKANTPAKIDVLPSALHRLMAVCGTDTLTTSFVTFTLADRKTAVPTHDWFYQSADRFAADGKPVYIQVGSSDSIQHVVYTIIAGNKIIEEGRADLRAEVRTKAISYKEEWGDGVTLSVAWVKSGHSYAHTARIERPMPDDRLQMKWTSFRDRLTPGQRETWTLHISRPDGTPARAQLLATLYDKSLDAIRPHSIRFAAPRFVNLPWLSWNGVYNRDMFAYSEMPMRFLDEPVLQFSHLDTFYSICHASEYNIYFGYGRGDDGRMYSLMVRKDSNVLAENETLAAPAAKADAPLLGTAGGNKHKAESRANQIVGGSEDTSAGDGTSAKSGESVQLRENLSETAFFYPGLSTDAKGNVSMQFTLPESVTTWQFYGLAHDKDMNNGTIAATSVARKTVMVQPNVPRFLRSTDRGVLSAVIYNTSEKPANGVARLTLLNPETGKEVYRKEQKFSVKAGESAAAQFDLDMAKVENDGLLICRVTASGRGYSDGEQHYLPVLPDGELVTNTVAFSQNAAGTLNVDLKNLFPASASDRRLTVEYTDNPAWLMVQALPSMTAADGDNAMSLASAFYANTIGKTIMQSTPSVKTAMELWKKEAQSAADGKSVSLQSALQKNEELKQMVLAESPWLMDADRESEQKQMLMSYFDESQCEYRLADNLSRLSRLQLEDGSFAWWKGMGGSPYMTMAVVKTLVRLNHMAGLQKNTANMLAAAFAYMDKDMAREVKELRKLEADGKSKAVRPSDTAVDYLYASTLAERNMSGAAKRNFDYLVGLLARFNNELTINDKATAAVVLAKNGHKRESADLLQSIREHTVYTDEMGRYFDSPKAVYSWRDYRIPTQVAAIEALKTLAPDDTQTVGEMQRWLLQSKRTQAWDTPLNSVDAVYAFLDGNMNVLSGGASQAAVIKLNGQKLSMPKATAALGYVKVAKTGGKFEQISVEKTSDGTSWGAVYAQSMQPTADVDDAATGMRVSRELWRNGQKLQAGNVQLAVGDRITVRITVEAQRDYDFVQLADRRAACLEPAEQISGYGYGYYCQPKDNATNYFFDRMSKGKHVVETVYFVDRSGVYQTGTCAVQCAYSPEFMARTKALTLNVR